MSSMSSKIEGPLFSLDRTSTTSPESDSSESARSSSLYAKSLAAVSAVEAPHGEKSESTDSVPPHRSARGDGCTDDIPPAKKESEWKKGADAARSLSASASYETRSAASCEVWEICERVAMAQPLLSSACLLEDGIDRSSPEALLEPKGGVAELGELHRPRGDKGGEDLSRRDERDEWWSSGSAA